MNVIKSFFVGLAGVLVLIFGWEINTSSIGMVRFIVCGVAGMMLIQAGEYRSKP